MTVAAEIPKTSSESFFEDNRDNLAELFDVLRMPPRAADDLEEAVALTQPWVAGDHHTPMHVASLTEDQERDSHRLFEMMELKGEKVPPAGQYEQLVILGAMMDINNRRTEFARRQLDRPDITLADGGKVAFWGGPRMPLERELPAIARSIIAAGNAVPHDTWLRSIESGDEKLIDEASQGRLSLLSYFGALTLRHIDLRIEDREPIKSYTFNAEEVSLNAMEIVVMNARTVSREKVSGQPRHTTESCAEEWLTGEHAPVRGDGTSILFVTNNPHTRRTTASVQDVVDKLGANHIDLVGCGPAAYEDAKTSLYLGEVGRLLYTDLTRHQAGRRERPTLV